MVKNKWVHGVTVAQVFPEHLVQVRILVIPLNMKRQQTLEELKRFLKGSGFARGTLGFDPRNLKLLAAANRNRAVQIFYGETVDEFGMTVDSLKYYFFLSLLQKYLESVGIRTEATIVIADVASILNDSAREREEGIKRSVERRKKLLHKIIAVYDLPIRMRLMSDIFCTRPYNEIRRKIDRAVNNLDVFVRIEPLLSKTVLINRLAEERKKKFQYALDAIATGLKFDIKIGPPRERFYDEAAQVIAKHAGLIPMMSIYLTATQPLGKDFAFFFTHPEIEEYGVTPYKAGSNKLQEYRIVLGETPLSRAKTLIETSFESINKDVVHPVLDLYAMTELAKRLLTKDSSLPFPRLGNLHSEHDPIATLKEATMVQLREYIYRPLRLEEL